MTSRVKIKYRFIQHAAKQRQEVLFTMSLLATQKQKKAYEQKTEFTPN